MFMANYHLTLKCISRKKKQSAIARATYQSGEKLRDDRNGKTYYKSKSDSIVLYTEISLPPEAPREFKDRQTIWREVDRVEKRSDARTARELIISLPNELILDEQIELVRDFVYDNFVSLGMCADIAIHLKKNKDDPKNDNPHAHILLTTRPVDKNGFCPKKNRDWDKRTNVILWRENWEIAQNRFYERKGLDVRVTHRSYKDRGIINREPIRNLNRREMSLEKKNIPTPKGEENRAIKARNLERENEERERLQERKREYDRGRGR